MKILGEDLKNDFTTEQLLNPELKNSGGESNLEVKDRMLDFIKCVLESYSGGRIAMVSHGAAIKFLIQNYCEYDDGRKKFLFENKEVCSEKLESPSILKLIFDGYKLVSIEEIKINRR